MLYHSYQNSQENIFDSGLSKDLKANEIQLALNSMETGQTLHHQGLLQKAEPSKDAAFHGKETLSLQEVKAAIF